MTLARKGNKQRIMVLVSGLFFLVSMGAGTASMFTEATAPAPTKTPEAVTEETASLQAQIRGYELVLQREPNNPTALEGLAMAHLQAGNIEGAIAPLEKLVELYPDRADYAEVLATVKEQLDEQ